MTRGPTLVERDVIRLTDRFRSHSKARTAVGRVPSPGEGSRRRQPHQPRRHTPPGQATSVPSTGSLPVVQGRRPKAMDDQDDEIWRDGRWRGGDEVPSYVATARGRSREVRRSRPDEETRRAV